jgi:hypothetical protein
MTGARCQRLKVQYDGLLSSFTFEFNWHPLWFQRLKLQDDEPLPNFVLIIQAAPLHPGQIAVERSASEIRNGGDDLPYRGRVVQINPMIPKLKPPGNKRLKLKRGILLSNSSFNLTLAATSGVGWLPAVRVAPGGLVHHAEVL